MSAPNPDVGLVSYVVGAIAAGTVAIVAWVGKHTVGRISALETGKVDMKTFDEAMERAETGRKELRASVEQQRIETRENVIAVHGKIDGLRDHVDEKLDRLADLIREEGRK